MCVIGGQSLILEDIHIQIKSFSLNTRCGAENTVLIWYHKIKFSVKLCFDIASTESLENIVLLK